MILSCVLFASSISVEIKTCLQYILYTMPRPYSAHDLLWRIVYQRLFYQRRYKEIASQLFVCSKTVYRTITLLNSGDVKPYRLGRPTGSASLFDHEESIHNGLYSSNTSDTATGNSQLHYQCYWLFISSTDIVSRCSHAWNNA